jgi:hypothetical protein
VKTEPSVINSSKECLKSNIPDLLEYLTASDLSTALAEVTELSALLLSIPMASESVKRSFSALNRVHTYNATCRLRRDDSLSYHQ